MLISFVYMRILFNFSENTELTSNMYSNCESSNYLYPYFFQIASIVTLPFDVVKTRRQVELGELQAKNCNIEINLIILTLLIIQLLSGVSLHMA